MRPLCLLAHLVRLALSLVSLSHPWALSVLARVLMSPAASSAGFHLPRPVLMLVTHPLHLPAHLARLELLLVSLLRSFAPRLVDVF